MEKYLERSFKGKKQGFLNIKEKKKLKKHWLVIEDDRINVFHDMKDTSPVESITIQLCSVKVGDDPGEPEMFKLQTPKKNWEIVASTFSSALDWGNLIKVLAAIIIAKGMEEKFDPSKDLTPPPSSYQRARTRSVAFELTEWGKVSTQLLDVHSELELEQKEWKELEKKLLEQQHRIKSLQSKRFSLLSDLLRTSVGPFSFLFSPFLSFS